MLTIFLWKNFNHSKVAYLHYTYITYVWHTVGKAGKKDISVGEHFSDPSQKLGPGNGWGGGRGVGRFGGEVGAEEEK